MLHLCITQIYVLSGKRLSCWHTTLMYYICLNYLIAILIFGHLEEFLIRCELSHTFLAMDTFWVAETTFVQRLKIWGLLSPLVLGEADRMKSDWIKLWHVISSSCIFGGTSWEEDRELTHSNRELAHSEPLSGSKNLDLEIQCPFWSNQESCGRNRKGTLFIMLHRL